MQTSNRSKTKTEATIGEKEKIRSDCIKWWWCIGSKQHRCIEEWNSSKTKEEEEAPSQEDKWSSKLWWSTSNPHFCKHYLGRHHCAVSEDKREVKSGQSCLCLQINPSCFVLITWVISHKCASDSKYSKKFKQKKEPQNSNCQVYQWSWCLQFNQRSFGIFKVEIYVRNGIDFLPWIYYHSPSPRSITESSHHFQMCSSRNLYGWLDLFHLH